jgi:hypothetical protein
VLRRLSKHNLKKLSPLWKVTTTVNIIDNL